MASMGKFRGNRRINRLLVLVVALFVSNIAIASCAMAYALCNECPEHVPAHCADPCATTDVAVNDKSSDAKSDVQRPVAHRYTILPSNAGLIAGATPVAQHDRDLSYSSPPLHLQYCVFLK